MDRRTFLVTAGAAVIATAIPIQAVASRVMCMVQNSQGAAFHLHGFTFSLGDVQWTGDAVIPDRHELWLMSDGSTELVEI